MRDVHTFPTSLADIKPEDTKALDKPQEDSSNLQVSTSSTEPDASSHSKDLHVIQSNPELASVSNIVSAPEFGSRTEEDTSSDGANQMLPLMIPEVMTNETRSDATTPSNSTTSDTLQDLISVEDSRPTPDEVKSVTFEPLPHVSESSSPMVKQECSETTDVVS